MPTIKTIIVDDEPLALGLLRSKLSKNGNVEIVAACKNGREAIDAVMSTPADVMFLDIQMPGLDGLDVVKNLQSDELPLIVFTTAFEQYAINAFDLHAVDYILKPIDQERIDRAVERVINRLGSEDSAPSKANIIGALGSMDEHLNESPSAASERKIVIREREEITLLNQEDIAWLEAAGDYVCIHANGETHIKRSTLKELLEELDPTNFKRIHRSTIVNLKYIEKVIPHTKGEFFLILGEFNKLKVSRNYRDVIKAYLDAGA